MTRDEQWEQLRSLVAFLESNTTPHIHRRDAVGEARRTIGPAIDALQVAAPVSEVAEAMNSPECNHAPAQHHGLSFQQAADLIGWDAVAGALEAGAWPTFWWCTCGAVGRGTHADIAGPPELDQLERA